MDAGIDWGALWQFRGILLSGVWITLKLTFYGLGMAIPLGFILALARIYSRAASVIITLFMDILRSVPFIVQIIWLYYGLPLFFDVSVDPFMAGVTAIVVYQAAFFAEIFRAGINAVPTGQKEAGLALGFKERQVNVRFILPQSFVIMLPTIMFQVAMVVKESALVSVIGVPEMLHASQRASDLILNPQTFLTFAMLMYCVLVYAISFFGSEPFFKLVRKVRAKIGAGRYELPV